MRKEQLRKLEENIYIANELSPSEFEVKQPPVVTIYLPLERNDREGRRSDHDRIEYKNLAKKAIKDVQEHWGKWDVKGIVNKLEYIESHEDMEFWLAPCKGLAFLVTNDEAYVYEMDTKPEAKVVVSDKFDTEPLVGEAERDDKLHYKLLLLSSDFFSLLEGDAVSVHYVELPADVKNYFAETYPEFDGETTALDYFSLEDHMSPFHGHKSRNDVTKEETEKFFRYVDKVMNDKLVRNNVEPIILVTLPEHENEFRKICTFDHLCDKAILKDPSSMTGRELRDAAIKILS